MAQEKDPLSRYSSKIKDIYLQLHDYSFFHSPSGLKKEDARFIGRETIIQKLHNILTNSETRAGAYLVTGYRGVGKTSLVRKVLAKVRGEYSPGLSIYLILLVCWLFLGILLGEGTPEWLFETLSEAFPELPDFYTEWAGSLTIGWILSIIVGGVLVIYYFLDTLRVDLFHDEVKKFRNRENGFKPFANAVGSLAYYLLLQLPKIFTKFLYRLVDWIDPQRDFTRKTIGGVFLSFFLALLVLFLMHRLCWRIPNSENIFLERLGELSLSFMLYFLTIRIAYMGYELRANYREEKRKWQKGSAVYWSFFGQRLKFGRLPLIFVGLQGKAISRSWEQRKEWITARLNHAQKIPLELSLAQKDLSDTDILRLIAKNVYQRYKRICSPFYSLRRSCWSLVLLMFLYFLTSALFYNHAVYHLVNDLRSSTGLVELFPSQQAFTKPSLRPEIKAQLIPKEAMPSFRNFQKTLMDSSNASTPFSRNVETTLNIAESTGSSQTELKTTSVLLVNSQEAPPLELTAKIDYFLSNIYCRLLPQLHLKADDFWGKSVEAMAQERQHGKGALYLHSDFRFIPYHIDYLFWCFFLLVLIAYGLCRRWLPLLGIPAHRSVLLRLRHLNDRIDTNLSLEMGSNIGLGKAGGAFGWLKKRSRHYPIAGAREIETELIQVFQLVDRIPRVFYRPEFIFILDELDKVQVDSELLRDKPSKSDQKEEQPAFGPEYTRKRQEAIAVLLGHLKHFLSVAKAKFIFIASREMYDVSLADISDRDAYIGSVFHEVLHVPSFYTDSYSRTSSDITRLTEEYVCQFLVPPGGEYAPSLKGYHQYLKRKVLPDPKNQDKQKFPSEASWQREKIIFTLQNFIIYLTYRSNGKPKNLTRLLEEQLRKPEERPKDDFNLVAGRKVRCFYLYFPELQQYKFGFTTYIFSQFLVNNSRYMREYGDKLLVSSSYLIDHLYKFHNYAFSWQNLEVTPELIDINKAPELRSFIQELVQTVSNVHLREIVSGLYQFKFYKKITNEIRFISKVSEIEASAFNFTLDEHLQTKRYYQMQLKRLKEDYRDYNTDDKKGEYIHSIGSVQMTLGDLHYFDQEYEEAKLQYSNAIQSLKTFTPEELSMQQFLLLIRNMLKLGLAHERTGSNDMALTVYGMVANNIVQQRNLEFQEFGMVKAIVSITDLVPFACKFAKHLERDENIKALLEKEFSNKETGNQQTTKSDPIKDATTEIKKYKKTQRDAQLVKKDIDVASNHGCRQYQYKDTTPDCSQMNEPQWARLVVVLQTLFDRREEKVFYGRPPQPFKTNKQLQGKEYWHWMELESFFSFSEHFPTQLNRLPANATKEALYFKRTLFESLRLIYQPLLAKLQAIEKSSLEGIKHADLKRTKKEFDFLFRTVHQHEKPLIQAEFYNKIGHILYFKNGYLFGTYNKNSNGGGNKRISLKGMLDRFELTDHHEEECRDFKAPLHAFEYYLKSLDVLRLRVWKYSELPVDFRELEAKPMNSLVINLRSFLLLFLAGRDNSSNKTVNQLPDLEKAENDNVLRFPTMNNTLLEAIGNNLSDLGDALLGMIDANKNANTVSTAFLVKLLGGKVPVKAAGGKALAELDWKAFSAQGKKTGTWIKDRKVRLAELETALSPDNTSRLELVLLCYCMAGIYFSRAGLHLKNVSQNMKILYVLKDFLSANRDQRGILFSNTHEQGDKLLGILKYGLVHKSLQGAHRAHQGAGHIEVEKHFFQLLEEVFNAEGRTERIEVEPKAQGRGMNDTRGDRKSIRTDIRNYLSNNSEMREVLVLYSEVCQLVCPEKAFPRPTAFLLHAYSGVNSQFVRALELKLKSHRLKWYYHELSKNIPGRPFDFPRRKIKSTKLSKYFPADSSMGNVAEFLITDSIYCFWEVIRMYKVYGLSYMTSHSVMGFAYYSLGYWSMEYQLYLKTIESPSVASESQAKYTYQTLTGWELDNYLSFKNKVRRTALPDSSEKSDSWHWMEPDYFVRNKLQVILPNGATESHKRVTYQTLAKRKLDKYLAFKNTVKVPKKALPDSVMKSDIWLWQKAGYPVKRVFVKKKLTQREQEKANRKIRALNHKMSKMLGTDAKSLLNPAYHYEQALQHFYSCLQTHNEGEPYHKLIQRMYFLEDDFSDKLYHFGAASERYKINTGVIRKKMNECKEKLESLPAADSLYSYEGYVHEQE